MRIHFLVTKDIYHGGGIETYAREVGSRLAARGHDVLVYSTAADTDRPAMWHGMRVVWLRRVRPHWLEKTYGSLAGAIRERAAPKPDIIHFMAACPGCTAPLLRSLGVPFVLQLHGVEWLRSRWGPLAAGVIRWMERSAIASADAVTAVSETQCRFYAARYGVATRCIPNAGDVKPRLPAREILPLGLVPGRFVLFAARLVQEKGAHYLINAFRLLDTDCTLAIAGDHSASGDYWPGLLELAAGDPRIRFLGHVGGNLLAELFSNARAFVLPSEMEGMSLGLIEAMGYGNACVVSDIPENVETSGEAALYFRNRDICSLAEALRRVLHDRELAARLGASAQERVRTLFSWDRVVAQLEDLYWEALQGREGAEAKRVMANAG